MANSDKRMKLLEACRELLNEIPARELTLDLVAERSGISRGLIFYYFSSREGLLLGATENFRDSFLASFDGTTVENSPQWLVDEISRLIDRVRRDTGMVQAATFELGSVPGVTEALEAINKFNSDRVAAALGITTESTLFHALIGAWGVYCARLTLDGVRYAHVTNEQLIELMKANLTSSLDLIRSAEPELGIPEHPFS